MLRHPSGRPIEALITAGSRAGASLVARWLVGVIFDEFAMMAGEGDAVINWSDQRKQVRNRILPNGGICHIGSPWAPFGPAFAMVQDHLGKPSRRLVVFKAPGPAMNPTWWTPERVEEARAADPDAFRMTVMAEFGTPPEAMFANGSLIAATREADALEPDTEHLTYTAAIDPATRGNGWTLVIATRRGGKRIVVYAREWRGSREEPLDPDTVLAEIAGVLVRYGIKHVYSDQWAADPLKALAKRHGLSLVEVGATTEELFERYKAFHIRLESGDIELPPQPGLQADLRRVQKRITTRGWSIHLPHTSDGRHCDFAPAVMLALHRYLLDEREDPPPAGSPAAHQLEADAMRAAKLEDVKRRTERAKQPYWRRLGARG